MPAIKTYIDVGFTQRRGGDDFLVRGSGRFVDDVPAPGAAYAVFVRSPHGHARLLSLDTEAACQSDDVLAVFTAEDFRTGNARTIYRHFPMNGHDGLPLINPPRPVFADERAMHIGQPIALIVAKSNIGAENAAEKIVAEYDPLESVTDVRAAIEKEAPQLWKEAKGNICIDWRLPSTPDGCDAEKLDQIIMAAPLVARASVINQRISPAPIEPRGAIAEYDRVSDRYTLWICSQGAVTLRDELASALDVANEKIRVITGDVGGSFGMKSAIYPEYPALLFAAKKLGRPVRWMATRSESFLSDSQARDMVADGELALDRSGKFLALRVSALVNLGAYVGNVGVHIVTNNFSRCFPAMYAIPAIDIRVRCAFTNTIPTAPYRGAGRPEANYLLEKLVERAGLICGLGPEHIRKRNLIPSTALPFLTAVGTTYDSGNFHRVFAKALELSSYKGFPKRRRKAAARGFRRGIGLSCFLEHSGGPPTEGAALQFPGDKTVIVAVGSQSTGQSHSRTFSHITAKSLQIPIAHVVFRQGDSDLGVTSLSTMASRSTITVGGAIVKAAQMVIQKGCTNAATLLEADERDIIYRDGQFVVAGTDRSVGLFELATAIFDDTSRPFQKLDTNITADTPQAFPNGCHVAEVEIDPETGAVSLIGYWAVDDVGNVIDHKTVEAQLQGGIVQGIGQALMEKIIYDDAGQLVSGSFTDYAMPRAADLPELVAVEQSTPAKTNPLGVKGVGEAGTTAALAAVMNAISNALGNQVEIEMPATPEKLWRACKRAQSLRSLER